MNLLVIGAGGREHALAWKLSQSSRVRKLYCAPGNAGIAAVAECVEVQADDVTGLLRFAQEAQIDFTVVGPELPLTLGIVDEFERAGLRIFGPTQTGAQLEGSKSFCKTLLAKQGIPTAAYEVFSDAEAAKQHVTAKGAPIVIKADGLAAGKGVVVAQSVAQAHAAIDRMMTARVFGAAGGRVVIEACLSGPECSVIALTDGETVLPLAPAQDYKRAFDDDRGPNTGGMGSYSPVPALSESVAQRVLAEILQPTVAALRAEGVVYRGALYAGLMLTDEGPSVVEFNCRFGDPETQCILPRLDSDLLDLLLATTDGTLARHTPRWRAGASVCVVMASGGYPGEFARGKLIGGVEAAEALDEVVVFHAGTARTANGLVTSGGRVFGVTAVGDDYRSARERAYEAVGLIDFDGAHVRSDIGPRG